MVRQVGLVEEVVSRGANSAGWQRLLIEPKRPDRIRNRPGAFWLTVAAVCIGAFMGQLDASIVTVALPTLQHTFHASVGAVTWVGLSYLLVLVATVVAVGRFADMWGRKLLYVYGFGIFIIGSALCGLGPTGGGFLLAAGGWRLIFFVNVPFGLVGMIAGVLLIPRSRNLQDATPFDWSGFTLFFPAVVALFAAISFGNARGWSSPSIIGLLVGGSGLVVGFVLRERRCEHPMLDLRLFHQTRFSAGITSGLLSYLVMFGVLFLVPFYLERGVGLGSGRSGLELMVMPVALGATAPLAGRIADRIGARPLTVGGMASVAVGLTALAALRPETWLFVVLLAVVGFGMGAFIPPNNATIMGSVPANQAGVASGVLNMTRGMGTSFGLAVTGLIFDATGGSSASSGSVAHAFSATCLVLAGLAFVAGLIAGTSEGGPIAVPAGVMAE